jgi:transposase
VPGVPDVPSAGELSALPPPELAGRLAEAYRLTGELTARVERLSAEAGDLRRRVRRDSSTSSRPPSSDNPYQKTGTDRSLRERGKRSPGKQPGEPGTTMKLVDDPDERFEYPPPACRGCGADLAGEPVAAQRRHQVTDIEPAPAPKVTEHVAQAKRCPCCGAVSEGELPEHVRARASYGPETCAQAANLAVGHHIPTWRSTVLLCQLAGIAVSTGWMAGIRGKAAVLVEASGFTDRVRYLLKAAPAAHADETPVRFQNCVTASELRCYGSAGEPGYSYLPGTPRIVPRMAGDHYIQAALMGRWGEPATKASRERSIAVRLKRRRRRSRRLVKIGHLTAEAQLHAHHDAILIPAGELVQLTVRTYRSPLPGRSAAGQAHCASLIQFPAVTGSSGCG